MENLTQRELTKLYDMDLKDFRAYSYKVIDWICNYFSSIDKYPVLSSVKPGDIKNNLSKFPPKTPESIDQILDDFEKIILPGITHWNHPSFFAYFATSSSCPGILGELLISALNVQGMLWKTSPSCTELEEVVMSYLRQMLGLPENYFGLIYDYASVSTTHAICAARESLNLKIKEEGLAGRNDLSRLIVYCSSETHSSIEKAAIMLGIGQNNVRKVSTNNDFQMNVSDLELQIKKDKELGFIPVCVVGTIGTTSSTSIDPIDQIADICEKYKIWLHVDGAYGGVAGIIPEMKYILKGCDRADSIVINPHKWLFTPLDLSVLYCRKPEILKRAFSLVPEYLKTEKGDEILNLMDYGIQLGRRFRALKLWMVIRSFGQEGLIERLREHIRLAKTFSSWVDNDTDFERLAPVPLSNVCFRFNPKGKSLSENDLANLNEKIMNSVNESGKIYISHTKLKSKHSLRFAVGNIRTTEDHVKNAWDLIKEYSCLELKNL